MLPKASSTFTIVQVGVAIVILIVASAFSTITSKDIPAKLPFKLLGLEEFRPDKSLDSFVTARAMKPLLPPHGTVGYLTDSSTPPYSLCFIMMQHGLAPLRLEDGNSYPYVVGCFLDQIENFHVMQKYDLEIVRDFGNGYAIFRKRH